MKKEKLIVIFAMTMFGTIGLFVHYTTWPSAVIALARSGVGVLVLLLVQLCRRRKTDWGLIKRNIGLLVASGIFLGFNWIFLFEAYRRTTVAIGTLCYYLAPIILIAASPFVFGERLTLKRVLCVAVALVGMVFVSGVFGGMPQSVRTSGIVFGLASAVLYAGTIYFNKIIVGMDPLDKTVCQLVVSTVVLLPYCALTHQFDGITVTALDVTLVGILCVVHTAMCYALYFKAIENLQAQTFAMLSYIDPVVALFCSAVLLGEPLSVAAAIGAVFILGAAFVSELGSTKKS